ncbi:MAG: hypothetical protein BroJett040_08210 [Oligoflexia bacterium]|nr:MAG: hypothetical protein BroJett040_08210 [Oligoflexia bacterium]
MKNIFLVCSFCTLVQSTSFASTFLGKVGPFYQDEMSTETALIKHCIPVKKNLQCYVEKSSANHIPRIKFDFVTLTYESGFQETIEGAALGSVRGFNVEPDSENGCLKNVTLRASDTGFNPGHQNVSYVEIWAD